MNSSLLSTSSLDGAELPTAPLPPASVALLESSFYHTDEEATRFQSADGTIQPSPRLFKNRFEIIRRLGKGGFGTTYLAQDISTPQPMTCVIKQLKYKLQTLPTSPDHALSEPSSAQTIARSTKAALTEERIKRRFQREARMMARLGRHSQLPCLLDHFISNGQFYLVQEHIPGHTLSKELNHTGPQTEAQVKAFLCDMIPIIRYIHRQNLLHLDIKPGNIMRRSSDNKLVLIDFGAVRRYPNESTAAEGDRCSGTIGFASHEQLKGNPTFASDIYSLGVTCLYMLTKISPLDLTTSANGQNLQWRWTVSLNDHFTGILAKMLHPEASHRFQDTHELERAMNLEPHYSALKGCLTTEPLTDKRFSGKEVCRLEQPEDDTALSPAQRQAASIRRWQQRRRQFKTFTPS